MFISQNAWYLPVLALAIAGAAAVTALAQTTTAPAPATPPATSSRPAPIVANYDESKIPPYTLPDVMKLQDGTAVTTTALWTEKRRPEILELYRKYIYGRSPAHPKEMTFDVENVDEKALGGRAIRKQITVNFFGPNSKPQMHMLMYLPTQVQGPKPVILALSFSSNHAMTKDPGVKIYPTWNRGSKQLVAEPETTRGTSRFWDFDEMLARGYGVCAICYNDIEPDFADGSGWSQGVRGHYFPEGKTQDPEDWGAIGAWAWGASCGVDYLVTDKDVDTKHIVMLGQSRLGKTALWAGAQDERFAAVIACNSGEMGASLNRRIYGETVDSMSRSFAYQFCGNFQKWRGNVNNMPVDAHFLVAAIAPRPLYLTTGSVDQWSDPKGEFLAAVAAGPVWKLLGKDDLGTTDYPPLDKPLIHTLAFHVHTGKHETTTFDWRCSFDFLDLNFKGIAPKGIPSTEPAPLPK